MLFVNYDKQHIKLTYITHFYFNQNNIDSLTSLLSKYNNLPRRLREQVEFVIVDDGSPIEYDVPQTDLNLTLLRIHDDIRWNQGGARNLGVVYAKSDKIVMTDLDHEIPEHTLWYMVNHKNPGRVFYKLKRKNDNSGMYKAHSNIFFMSRARFLRFYGYDEEYSGCHGAEDYRFVKFQKYHGSQQKHLPSKYFCTERDINREDSYHSLTREQDANKKKDLSKKYECETYGGEYGHSRLFLNFRWECVHKQTLFPDNPPAERRHWKLLWWFRYAFPWMSL
ncbi:hypothetical protein SME20J_35460 [Serratia marcescens]|nr:hypothetical protein SME20J_35460 [Serratia marcescens]